jgi:glycine C-acetyltransferase/8-amino-7-oxononanoate synthase
VLVITESVFSMDGDRAPLAEIVDLKERYGALLMLDEAHALGVIGAHGRGLADELGVAAKVDVQMGTMSKALGVSGGYVAGSRALIDLLVNKARSFIYSTAPPPALAAAATAAVDLLLSADGEQRRGLLWANIRRLATRMLSKGAKPQSAILPLIVGDEAACLRLSRSLLDAGFLAPAIRYPTVAKGAARLRFTVSAAHNASQIDALCDALATLTRSLQ